MDIVVENLNKKYKDKIILSNFCKTFEEKSTTFIIGTSGIGKTTLIQILMELEEYDSGSIEGIENKKISAVFQSDSLCENLSVFLNVKLVSQNLTCNEVEKELMKIGLVDCMDKRVKELSGGMKRRVAIARALLYDFDLLIMDEPFKGLDEESKAKVMDFVIEKTKEKTVIIITHNLEEINYFRNHSEEKIIDTVKFIK
ncbi:MAG: ATP-binding cassette domain-containing protein [Endomicrobium sp.]|jgi:NitT/TauT family transport system ATP-binding protein|nr:ATP-binding cassette domain-containing protein [Endomicrobium sp.]